MQIKGKIKAVSQKDKNYGININDTWLNDFGTCPVKKGDNVIVQYETNGDFKNISSINVVSAEVVEPKNAFCKVEERGPYDKDPVGLAVEVFNAIHILTEIPDKPTERMSLSCDLVKQAQKAFS